MFKNYIYLNILFIFGLILYLFSQKNALEFSSFFYLFTSFYSIIISALLLLSEYKYKDREEKRIYSLLFFGFLIYGVANFIWYFNEVWFELLSLSMLNTLFVFQIFSKHYFLRYLTKQGDETVSKIIQNILSLNLGILLLSLFSGNLLNLQIFGTEIYFIFESLFSIVFITYFVKKTYLSHLDLRYFLTGNTFWLLADLAFIYEEFNEKYFMGNLSDFLYFVGFYLMLTSILFKNYNLNQKFNLYFEKGFSLS